MKISAVSWLGVVAAIVVACSSSTDTSSPGSGGNGGSGAGGGGGGSAGSAAMGEGGEGGAACIHCFEAILLMKPRNDVCPESADVFQKFADCTCVGACTTPCSETCTNPNVPPSIDCQTCIFQTGDKGCGDLYATCSADK